MKKLDYRIGLGVLTMTLMGSACTVTFKDSKEDGGTSSSANHNTDEETDTGTEDADGGATEADDTEQGDTDQPSDTDQSSAPVDTDDTGSDTDVGDAGTSDPEANSDGGADEADGGEEHADAPATGDAGTGETTPTAPSFACGSRDPSAADIVVDADVGEDTTWSGTVYLSGDYDIRSGATLTIEPGTNIIVAVDGGLEIGWNDEASTIDAQGTEAEPIVFCGEQAEAGYWRRLIAYRNVTSNSVMSNVLISDSGADSAALELIADIEINNVLVANSGSIGVEASDFADDSERLSVVGADGPAIVLDEASAVTNFPVGGSLADNADASVHLTFNDIREATVFHNVGVPYLQESTLNIHDGGDTTFEAGVDYRFKADTGLEVGWNGGTLTLNVAGTEANPVLFRGATDEPGFWSGIRIQRNVRSDSNLSHTTIMHAGAQDAYALDIQAPVTLSNVELSDNAVGAHIDDSGLSKDSENLSITATGGSPISVSPEALVTLPRGGSFAGNEEDEITVEGGNFSAKGTIAKMDVPYAVKGDISVRDGAVMTVEAGTHFIMSADTQLDVGWNGGECTLALEGTEADRIKFTARDERAGYWAGILIERNVLSDSKMAYVDIENAGVSGGAALTLKSPMALSNSSISGSAGYAILKDSTDPTDYTDGNSFSSVAEGDVGDL